MSFGAGGNFDDGDGDSLPFHKWVLTLQFWRKDLWIILGLLLVFVVGYLILLFLKLGLLCMVVVPAAIALPVWLLWGWVAGLSTFFGVLWLCAIIAGLFELAETKDGCRESPNQEDKQLEEAIAQVRLNRTFHSHERDAACPCWSCQSDTLWHEVPVQWPDDRILRMPVGRWVAFVGRTTTNLCYNVVNFFAGYFRHPGFIPPKHVVVKRVK
jgi:hypothetical protein